VYYNNQYERERIKEASPLPIKHPRIGQFVNLCIHPYRWELIYSNLKKQQQISMKDYEAAKGAVMGLIVACRRRTHASGAAVDQYIIDFIKLVQSDRQNDPEKFLYNMTHYWRRFQLMVGLQVAFGIDWRALVVDCLELKKPLQFSTYHSILSNPYARSLLHAYIIYRKFREPVDEDYELGVNDLATLMDKYGKSKAGVGNYKLQLLFNALLESLPSWNCDIRQKAGWAIDGAEDGRALIERQYSKFRPEEH
jgi:hypothetical protein